MKNRYIPFGYQIQNGDSVINTEQAATVQHISTEHGFGFGLHL